MKKKINILIIEDSISYAQGMTLLLEQNPKVELIKHSNDFKTTLDILKKIEIDVVLLDLNFDTNEFDGFMIAEKIRQQYPLIKIIVLSQNARKHIHNRLFKENLADAYLDKKLGIEETYTALSAVLKGEKYIDPNIKKILDIEIWMNISQREREVVNALSLGLTQKEVADKLHISPKTIETHISNLFKRLKVKNTTELVTMYIKYKRGNREDTDMDESTPPFKL